jgi:hypothetical protein
MVVVFPAGNAAVLVRDTNYALPEQKDIIANGAAAFQTGLNQERGNAG